MEVLNKIMETRISLSQDLENLWRFWIKSWRRVFYYCKT